MINFINKTCYFSSSMFHKTYDILGAMVNCLLSKFLNFSHESISTIATKLIMYTGKSRLLIGPYLAIPHVRIQKISTIYSGFFVIPEGVLADPISNNYSQFIWLMIFPPDWNCKFLNIVAQLEHFFDQTTFRQKLLQASTHIELHSIMTRHYLEYKGSIKYNNGKCERKKQSSIDQNDFILVRLVIINTMGIHARPSTMIVHSYQNFLNNLNKKKEIYFLFNNFKINPGYIMSIISMGCFHSDELKVIGYNCNYQDISLFLEGFGAVEICNGLWSVDFAMVYKARNNIIEKNISIITKFLSVNRMLKNIAYNNYLNRLRKNIQGDEKSDWKNAENKIIQLFKKNNHPVILKIDYQINLNFSHISILVNTFKKWINSYKEGSCPGVIIKINNDYFDPMDLLCFVNSKLTENLILYIYFEGCTK